MVPPGPYDLKVLPVCGQAYANMLRDAARYNVTGGMITLGLSEIKAACDQGSLPAGARPLDASAPWKQEYGITVHGYRFHFRVEKEKPEITIFRIENPVDS